MLTTCFRLFCRKPGRGPAAGHVEIDAAGSLVLARARQMECRIINRFEPANEPVEAGFSLRILLFVLIMT